MELASTYALSVGNVVFGRYRIQKCLGIGSIGTVYSCEVTGCPSQLIALKVLSPKAAADPKVIAAFRNEINASYRISSPHVVRCHEFFRDQELELMAIAMEHVNGTNLASALQSPEKISLEKAQDYIEQIAAGLAAIHSAGVIHHDLKPQNILIDKDGTVKITDFTAAYIGLGRQYTSSTSVFGTIQFLSPETVMYGWVDRRSDIYALGVISYLLVTGKLPFAGEDVVSQVHDKIYAKIVPPHLVNRECPYLLSKIIMKAMAREPSHRFQSVDEILGLFDTVDLNFRPGFFDRILGYSRVAGL